MKTSPSSPNPHPAARFKILAAAAAIASALLTGHAANVTWSAAGNATAGGDGDWTGGSTWYDGSTAVAWTASDNATFSAAGNTTVNSDVTANKLTFTNAAANISVLNGAGNLTVGAGGITATNSANTAARTYTISASSLILGANQTWTVNNGGIVGTANLAVSGVVSGAFNLTKDGSGTLTLSNDNTYTGSTTVSAGTLAVSGGSLASTSLNYTNGTFFQSGGTVNFTSGAGSGGNGANLFLTGGSFTASYLTLGRGGATVTTAPTLSVPQQAGTNGGIYVNGASAVMQLGSLNIGTLNSSGSCRVDAGSVTVDGAVIVGRTTNTGRWNILQVNGGSFTASDTTNGVILAPNNGTFINSAEFYISGGTATAGKIAFGNSTDTAGGNGFLILGNSTLAGTLYVGSGGIVKASTMGNYTYTIGFTNGTLGAAADWSSSLNATLGTNPTIKAADVSNTARDIALSGVLSGGGFTKTGAGNLTLSGANTFNGTATVSAGTLILSGGGSINASTGVTVATAATLENNTGTAITPAFILAEGSFLSGSGSFAPASLTLTADLSGGTLDQISLGAAFAKSGALEFTLTNVTDGSYTLFTGTSPTGSFASVAVGGNALADLGGGVFSADIDGFTYTYTDGTSFLAIAAVPEPGTWILVGIGLTFLLYRKRRRFEP